MIKYRQLIISKNKCKIVKNDIYKGLKINYLTEQSILNLFLNEYFIRKKWDVIFQYQYVSYEFLKYNKQLSKYNWKCSRFICLVFYLMNYNILFLNISKKN